MKFALANGITHSPVGEQKATRNRSWRADIVRIPKKESERSARTEDARKQGYSMPIINFVYFATEKLSILCCSPQK